MVVDTPNKTCTTKTKDTTSSPKASTKCIQIWVQEAQVEAIPVKTSPSKTEEAATLLAATRAVLGPLQPRPLTQLCPVGP